MRIGGLAVLMACLSFGCAYNGGQVKRRFNATFGCSDARTVREFGGYRVEGCGRVAHYRCFDPTQRTQWPGRYGGSLRPSTCLMEYVSEPPKLQRGEPRAIVEHDRGGQDVLHAHVSLHGGQLAVNAIPARDPEHVILTLRTTQPASEGSCEAHLFQDGTSVPVLQVERVGSHAAKIATNIAALHGVGQSLRFAGDVCGMSFELDDTARRALGEFEARFHEELARNQPATKI
jgi:hypothetical protein